MGDTSVVTPTTHSDDYADDQITYRPGQIAQVAARSSRKDRLSFQQANARRQARQTAGATQERTLFAVACNIPYPYEQSLPQKQGRIATSL
jgi:hypothetical protein